MIKHTTIHQLAGYRQVAPCMRKGFAYHRYVLCWRTRPHMTPCVDVKKPRELRQTDAGKSAKK